MRAFVFACIGAIAIALIGAVVLGSIQESADQAFSTFGCAPWSVKADVSPNGDTRGIAPFCDCHHIAHYMFV
jgi:hypothetical protein